MTEEPLAMNPFVDIHVHPAPESVPIDISRIQTITVRCPVRGRGLLIRDLTSDGDPALFAFFASLVAREGELELDSDAPLVPELSRIGFLVADEEIIDWPQLEVPFEARMDTASDHADPAGWIVSPTFCFQAAFGLHPGVAWPRDYDEQEGRMRCFAPGPAFWVGDPAELAAPHWVSEEWATVLAELRPGAAPPRLPAPLARALARVGALVPADRPAPAPLARYADHRPVYEAEGVVIVRDLLGADETSALRRYYASLLAAGLVPLGDRQNATRFSTYNDPVGRFVHARLAGAMSAIAGEPVVPSFSYFFSYLEGAALEPHKDRPQAELSISLQLDHAPAPVGATGWPLRFLFDDGRTMAADLAIGDAVFYHGRAVTHHRAPLPLGQRSSILVLEYVPRDFRGLLI